MQTIFEGIVMYRQPHREKDLLVKLLMPRYGKRMFFIKSGATANHPMAAYIMPFTINRYVGVINPSGFSFLKEGERLFFPKSFQTDVLIQAYMSYFIQLIDATKDDFHVMDELYQLLQVAMHALNNEVRPEIVRIYMELQLLPFFGVHLQWRSCVLCDHPREPYDFSMIHSGVICQKHFNEETFRMQVSPKSIHIIRLLAQHPLTAFRSFNISQPTLDEMVEFTTALYQEYVGIRLKSKQYLEQMIQSEKKIQQLLQQRSMQKDD